MNILEHYIIKIVSKEWVSGVYEGEEYKYLKVKFLADCYGDIREYEETYNSEEGLQRDLENGYFMA